MYLPLVQIVKMIDNIEISNTIQKASTVLASNTIKQANDQLYANKYCKSSKNVVCIYLYIFALESYLDGEKYSEEELIAVLTNLQILV